MPDAAWMAVIITLALFVVSNLVISIWWASRTNTVLEFVQKELVVLVDEFKKTNALFATKEAVARESAINDKDHQAIWKNIDEIKAKLKE